MKRFIHRITYKISKWWDKLWFNEMSRDFACTMDFCARRGIDFGDEPIENILKYWCRDTRKTWHRFFINWRQFDKELEHIALVRQYE